MPGILLFIILLLTLSNSEELDNLDVQTVYFPNIGYLGKGYDIYYGNSLSTDYGGDPGFRANIFDLSVLDIPAKYTADYNYYLPRGATADLCVSCNLQAEYSEIKTASEYQDDLKTWVSVSGGYAGASFSASASWRQMSQFTQSDQNVVASTTAQCSLYCASINIHPVGVNPALDQNFVAWVNWLPETYVESSYSDFFNVFGTHFSTLQKYGARFGKHYVMSKSQYSDLVSQGVKVEVTAAYSAFGASASASWGLQHNQQWQSSFDSKVTQQFTYSIGAPFPTGNDLSVWLDQTRNFGPAPMYIQLSSIDNLIASHFFPSFSQTRIYNLKANIQRFYASYCQKLYASNQLYGINSDCTITPPVAPPPPPPPAKCRLCKSCGGNYPNYQGKGVHDGDWGPYKMYGSSCSGSYKELWDEPQLCCSNDNNNQGCTLCASSCGGSYPYEAGRRKNEGDYGKWITRNTGCNGGVVTNSNRETVLCCKSDTNNCKWCTGGCGIGMTESGRRVNDGDWGPYNAVKNSFCTPNKLPSMVSAYTENTWSEVVLCCPN